MKPRFGLNWLFAIVFCCASLLSALQNDGQMGLFYLFVFIPCFGGIWTRIQLHWSHQGSLVLVLILGFLVSAAYYLPSVSSPYYYFYTGSFLRWLVQTVKSFFTDAICACVAPVCIYLILIPVFDTVARLRATNEE